MRHLPCLFIALALAGAVAAQSPAGAVVLKVGAYYDGFGHVLHNTRIVVEDGKIARLDPKATGTVIDLSKYTVMPGWIDMHVHITYHFGPNGKFDERPDPDAAGEVAANARATLMAGFTTVQSLNPSSAALEKKLRDDINAGTQVGPRILSSLNTFSLNPRNPQTPEQLREQVRQRKAESSDVIKIFASESIRTGAARTFNDEQLAAICGEATAQGLRSVVHAYKGAVRAATLAHCTEIEHGTYATPDDLALMAKMGTIFDPQVGLVIHNYLDHKAQFLGAGGFTEDGFAAMAAALPLNLAVFQQALKTRGLVVVFGTDAVAGAHGRNAEEFIYRVQDGGQKPVPALEEAQSIAAKALGMDDRIGALAPGLQADIIALDGDPAQDITAVRHVAFVMKGGKIYKQP